MTRSMTGYGKAEQEIGNKKITVEIRSLNSKQLDLSVKLPASYREREHALRSELSKRLQRGKVDVFINIESNNLSKNLPINGEVFKNYYNQLMQISSDLNMATDSGSLIQTIMRLPDVLQTEKDEIDDSEWSALDQVVIAAARSLDDFRVQEGNVLMRDLLNRVDKIEELKTSVVPYESERLATIKNRISENIESLNVPMDSNRLEQELIFYVEKLDITEEKVRLKNHCKYFKEVAQVEECPGRKLAFIAQEMGREINTLGSKANHAEIQKIVVQMKDELEKIKEQLLNLL